MAIPEIHCNVSTETTTCTIRNIPEYHLKDPDCEQSWSIVEESNTIKAIAMFPEKELDGCASSVTHASVVLKSPHNLTWSMNCGRYQGDYSASYVVPNGAVGGTAQNDTSQTPVFVYFVSVGILLAILVLVVVLLYRNRKKPQDTEYRSAESPDVSIPMPPLNPSSTAQQLHHDHQPSGALGACSANGTQHHLDQNMEAVAATPQAPPFPQDVGL